MENAPKSHQLETSLISLIYHQGDNSNLLSVMAETIGKHLQANACIVLTELQNYSLSCTGFWSIKDNLSILVENLLGLETIDSIYLSNEPLIVSEVPELGEGLAMKLDTQGRNTSILLVFAEGKNFWSDDKRLIFRSAGYLVAIALTTQAQADVLTNVQFNPVNRNMNAQNSPLVERLRKLMRQQFEQQRQLNEMKDDIIAAVSDRARNPLATLKMAIDALSDNQRNLPPKSQENYWRIIKHEWNTLNDLINNIVTLKQLKAQELTVSLQKVNLLDLVVRVSEVFVQEWQEDSRKGLELLIEDNLSSNAHEIETDPQHLGKIIHELLSNAGKFSRKETKVSLILSEILIEESKLIEIKIKNTGLGINKEEKIQIFQPFRRGVGVTDQAIAGTGIGLALVKGLVELLNGRVKVSTEVIEGSAYHLNTFSVILPGLNDNL